LATAHFVINEAAAAEDPEWVPLAGERRTGVRGAAEANGIEANRTNLRTTSDKPYTMKSFTILAADAAVATCSLLQLNAQTYPYTIWSDNFGSYNNGDLDSNESGGPNQAPNGGPGNSWWGPNPGNMVVANSFGAINPYPGSTKLIYGNSPSFFAEQINNIGYRLNGGNNFMGNVALSWAFYDPAGSGANAANYKDIAYLSGYQAADGYTGTKDYTGSGEDLQSVYTAGDEILGLGAPGGFNNSVYQARILGDTTGNHGATSAGGGWFNLGVARTVGWHTASIVLGTPNGANTTVSMFLDGTDVLDGTVGAAQTTGVNSIILDGGWGTTLGAFDNFAVSVPEPGSAALLLCGGLSWLALRRRK
jgi:hypothetical protein